MIKKSGKNLINRFKGFTLIEVIIVVAIIAVLTGIAAVGINAYIENSERIYREDVAKTVYYGLQDKLTSLQRTGSYQEDFVEKMAGKEVKTFTLEEMKAILSANGYDETYINEYVTKHTVDGTADTYDRICTYIYDGSNPDSFIKDTLFGITAEEKSLEHTFLIEINMKTGVVQSVFYSEEIEVFSAENAYDETTSENEGNVVLRDLDALRSKKQGYFGVYNTSYEEMEEAFTPTVEETDIKLVNGDRIYVKFIDKISNNGNGNGNGNGNKKDVSYKLVINAYDDNNVVTEVATLPVKITNEKQSSEMEMLDFVDVSGNTNLDDLSVKKQVELPDNNKTKAYENYILLDCLHRDFIRGNYEKAITDITGKPLEQSRISVSVIKVTPKGNSGKDREENLGISNIINPVFESYDQSSDTYYIANTRQLVNMQDESTFDGTTYRYNELKFALAKNIYMDQFECEGVGENVSYDVSSRHAYKYSSGDFAFAGSFDGRNHTIRGLYIDKTTDNQGLFCTVGFTDKPGNIKNIVFKDTYVKAGENVGAVAGKLANGQINNIIVDDAVVEGRSFVGGIVGNVNATDDGMSKLEKCTYAGKVTATGTTSNEINIKYCEITDTKVANNTTVLANTASFAGGITGFSNIPLKECKFTGQGVPNVSGAGDFVGGITGYSKVAMSGCEVEHISVSGASYVGGIAGACNDVISNCSVKATEENASVVKATGDKGHVAGIAAYAKGVVNSANNAVIMGKGRGIAGIVAVLADADNDDNAPRELTVSNCENGIYGGIMIGDVSSYVGGVIGRARENIKITNTRSKGDILASNYVLENAAGIIGYADSDLIALDTTSSASITCQGKLQDSSVTEDEKKHVNISGFAANVKGNVDIERSGNVVKANDSNPVIKINGCDLYNVGGIVSNIDNSKQLKLVEVSNAADITTNGNARYVAGIVPVLRYESSSLTLSKLSNSGNITIGDVKDATSIDNPENKEGKKEAAFVGGIVSVLSYPEDNKNSYEVAYDGDLINTGNITVTGYTRFAGGLIGYTDLYLRLLEAKNEGDIHTYDYGDWIGGLVGIIAPAVGTDSDYCLINKSSNSGDITVAGIASAVGGFVGRTDISLYVNAGPNKKSEDGDNKNTGNIVVGMTHNSEYVNITDEKSDVKPSKGGTELLNNDKTSNIAKAISADSAARNASSFGGVGGFVGVSIADSSYIGCSNTGDVKTSYTLEKTIGTKYNAFNIGGILGYAQIACALENCSATGNVETTSYTTSYVGGLLGMARKTASLQNCTYGGTITIGNHAANLGGIVGRINNGEGAIDGCVTTGNFKMIIKGGAQGNGNIGGIAGHIESRDANYSNHVKKSVANGEIIFKGVSINNNIAALGQVAGIVGNVDADTMTELIEDTNNIDIYTCGTTKWVGGIVGKVESFNVKIEDCINNGDIVTYDYKDENGNILVTGVATENGGIVGVVTPTAVEGKYFVITSCTNKGNLIADNKLADVGGCIGKCTPDVIMSDSVNEGEIISKGRMAKVGGLIGSVSSNAKIFKCVTTTKITTSHTDGTSYLSGIVGYTSKSNDIEKCQVAEGSFIKVMNNPDNFANQSASYIGGIVSRPGTGILTLADNEVYMDFEFHENTSYVGGIVGGLNQGTINHINNNSYKGTIEGKTSSNGIEEAPVNVAGNLSSVGGVIGYCSMPISVSGDLNSGFSLNENTAEVTIAAISNVSNAGGLIGYTNKDLTVDNIGNSIVKINSIHADGKLDCIGGILGKQDGGTLVISNVQIDKEEITAKGSMANVGGTLGYTKVPTVINNIESSATIKCDGSVNSIGGIVGKADTASVGSTMNMVNSQCVIEVDNQAGDINIGGIIGNNQGFGMVYDITTTGRFTIKNDQTSQKSNAGGLIGYNKVALSMTNCSNSVDIDMIGQFQKVGGVIGNFDTYKVRLDGITNTGNINCKDSSDINGNIIVGKLTNCGGLVGYAAKKTLINNSTNKGTISASCYLNTAGGIVGYATNAAVESQIIDVVSEGNIIAGRHDQNADFNLGGIIGNNQGFSIIKNTNNTGNSISINNLYNGQKSNVGGLVGYNKVALTMVDCTNEANIDLAGKFQKTGGIIGNIDAYEVNIVGITNTGSITCINATNNESIIEGKLAYCGGAIGTTNANVTVDDFENYGTIEAQTAIDRVGGIIGNEDNAAAKTAIRNSSNNASFVTSYNGTSESNAMAGVGGAIGFTVQEVDISDFTNTGDFVSTSTTKPFNGIGGLIGKTNTDSKPISITSSKNSGNFTGGYEVSSVGGAVGFTKASITIMDFGNEGSFYAVGDKTKLLRVGGVIGWASGSAPKTTISASEEGKTYNAGEFYSNVYDIVGSAVGKNEQGLSIDSFDNYSQNITKIVGDGKVSLNNYRNLAPVGTTLLELMEDEIEEDPNQTEEVDQEKEPAEEPDEDIIDEEVEETQEETEEDEEGKEATEESGEESNKSDAETSLEDQTQAPSESEEDDEKEGSTQDNSTPDSEDGIVDKKEDAILPEENETPDPNTGEPESE